MNILSVLALVFLTIDCQLDPYQYNVDLEEYNKIILKELEKDKSININRRKLSNIVEYVNPISKVNIGEDSIIEEFSVKIIAKGDVSYIYYPTSYKNTTIISYKLEVKDDKVIIETIEGIVKDNTLFDLMTKEEIGSLFNKKMSDYEDKLLKVKYTFQGKKLISLN